MKIIKEWLYSEDASSAMEYALMAAGAAVIFGSAYALLGTVLFDFFSTFIDAVSPF
jgi:Flp pilus assembly pilin Flp|tara:strand:+ start:751249 stop:751416 length:168 start_codon:yes stop_codon:yes gene_type:complete